MENFTWVCFICVLLFVWLFKGSSHVLFCLLPLRSSTLYKWYTSISRLEETKKEYVSQLPDDLLGNVVHKLTCFEDYLRFSEVCRFMRRFAREEQQYQKPWAMLGNKPDNKTRLFYSPLEGKFYNVKLPKVVRRSWCCGSYEGWLVMSHKTRGNFIYNPITRKRFRLPSHEVQNLDWFTVRPIEHTKHIKKCPYMLSKVVLSAVPTSSSSSSPLLAAAIAENCRILVTSCFPGLDNKWQQFHHVTLEEEGGLLSPFRPDIFIAEDDEDQNQEEEVDVKESSAKNEISHFITDIIFYRGQFYAVSTNGSLYVLKLRNDNDFSLTRVYMQPLKLKRKEVSIWNVSYLVESCRGQLLMVVRVRKRSREINPKCGLVWQFKTEKFLVFKLDESGGEPFRWVKVESLGDEMLFLGHQNYSKCISSIDIGISPGEIKGRGNNIYFTDHFYFSFYCKDSTIPVLYKDSGVYHLDDGSIDQFLPPGFDHHLYTIRRYPVIFTPNPW